MNVADKPVPSRKRLYWLLGLLAIIGLVSVVFRGPIRREQVVRSLLRAEAPSEETFRELADGTANPFPMLRRFWETQKIPHRAMVVSYLKDKAETDPALFKQAEPLLQAAALDVDESVRELALATLAQQKHPAVPRLSAALLRDKDPQMRLLGLQYLRKQEPAAALPLVVGLLDDPDLKVATMAAAALRNWTKQDFGVRVSMANFNLGGDTSVSATPENLKLIGAGIRRWKEWWSDHKSDYPASNAPAPVQSADSERLPVADFALKDLTGRTVRLSDFKGKAVLLNFWTTWCAACSIEIPDLIELQRKNADRLVVLGISLDGLPELDEHGDLTGSRDGDERSPDDKTGFSEIRAKVDRFAKDKGINYIVLLDPTSEVGRRFNGGELPTNVLIDPDGYMRRRFLGGRAGADFEAMIGELARDR